MDELRIHQLTKEMDAEELRILGDPCAAAAAVVHKTLSAALQSPPDGTPSVFRVRVGTFKTRREAVCCKLMRDIDLTRVREILGAKAAKSALEAQRFQRVENWRTRLIGGGPGALTALHEAYPSLDAAEWHQRVAAATTEHERTGAGAAASRELFRALRELLG